MTDVVLTIDGREFGGWTRARVTCGMEAASGGFELEVVDRWHGQERPWPIRDEDECTVAIAGHTLITGTVDGRHIAYSATEHRLTVDGRDKTGELVDCSAELKQWELYNVDPLAFAREVAKPLGIRVSMQPGIQPTRQTGKVAVDPGESAFDAIERVCRLSGLLAMADGQGGLLLTRAGTRRAVTALVQGENILAAEGDFVAADRFARYIARGQRHGTSEDGAEVTVTVRGDAEDAGVRRKGRVLIVRPEGDVTSARAKRRAEWEAVVRAARGETYVVTVHGWLQADGSPWPVNALVHLRSPFLEVDDELLITQAEFELSLASGTATRLHLKRPDAFTPQPIIPERRTGDGGSGGFSDLATPGPWRKPPRRGPPAPWVPPTWTPNPEREASPAPQPPLKP